MRVAPSRLVGVVVAAVGVVVGVIGMATAGGAEQRWTPAPDTIVKVTGDRANGFGIHYYDGSAIFPPTDSESMAECSEYDRQAARVRCRTEVRIWYRDLADMKRAINYARSR